MRNKRGAFIYYRYSKLCKLLPIKGHKYFSLAKQQLDPGNEELKDTGFISKFEWSENGKKDWLIYYWPGERVKKEMKNGQAKQLEFKEDDYLTDPDDTDKKANVNKQPESDQNKELADHLIDLNGYKGVRSSHLTFNQYNHILILWQDP